MSEEQIAEKENDNLKNLKTILRKVYMDKMKQSKVLLIKPVAQAGLKDANKFIR